MEESKVTITLSLFNISLEDLLTLLSIGVDLNCLYILNSIQEGKPLPKDSKIEGWIQTLKRKGFLYEEGTLTPSGETLINHLRETGSTYTPPLLNIKKEKAKKQDSLFTKWWEIYPANDTFVHQGKKFEGSRGLRVKLKDCEAKFWAILAEGKYTGEDMIRALQFEVHQKKEASVKDRTNKLKFMQNSMTYLNQGTYENFMEISKNFNPATHTPKGTGVVDI